MRTPEVLGAYRGVYRANYRSVLDQVRPALGATGLLHTLVKTWLPSGRSSRPHRADEVNTILGRTGLLGFFSVIVSAEMVEKLKPAPQPYLKALALLGLSHFSHRMLLPLKTRQRASPPTAAGLRVFAVRHAMNRKTEFCRG